MSASQHPADAEAPLRLPDSRARSVEHPKIDDAAARVDYIVRLMAARHWSPETSRQRQRELGAAWGISESTVRNYSTEAGRQIALLMAESRPVYAQRALDRLEDLAEQKADSPIPGDAAAAVRANEVLLRATGYAEPEEDKQRPTTLVQVGQVVASPVFGALLAGHEPKKLNGHTNGANGQANGHAEGSDVLPANGSDVALVRKA